MRDWQDSAALLWGADWIAPMAEVFGINRRTIERWRAGEGLPPAHVAGAVQRIASRAGNDAPVMGALLRRLARGETREDVRSSINALKRCLMRIDGDPMFRAVLRDWRDGAD